MRQSNESSNLGVGLVVWAITFAASWIVFLLITDSTGLTLVFSVFLSLLAFDLGRRSLRLGLVIIGAATFILLLKGFYLLAT